MNRVLLHVSGVQGSQSSLAEPEVCCIQYSLNLGNMAQFHCRQLFMFLFTVVNWTSLYLTRRVSVCLFVRM
jgi:hypothetical protein